MEDAQPASSDSNYPTEKSGVPSDAAILQRIIADFAPLSDEARRRILETVTTFFGISGKGAVHSPAIPAAHRTRPQGFQFSEQAPEEAPTVKQFMLDKAPNTDVERAACLAFYLTHFRDTPHFKTQDITALNTEAAQRRFSNTAFAVDNAAKAGYLVPSIKGCKQLSAAGEQFVQALPDREAARQTMERFRPRRTSGGKKGEAKNVKEH